VNTQVPLDTWKGSFFGIIIALTTVVGTPQSQGIAKGTGLKRPSLGLKPHLMSIGSFVISEQTILKIHKNYNFN